LINILNKLTFPCPKVCGFTGYYESLLEHFKTECPMVLISCPKYCDAKMLRVKVDDHVKDCPGGPVPELKKSE